MLGGARNLLINGDFQINQRGQSEYTNANDKVIYTLDMWKVNMNSNITVKPIINGVQLICSSFTGTSLFGQEMDFKLLGGTFTLVSKIDGQIYSHVFENIQAANSHDLGNGIAFWINSSDSYNTVGLLFKEDKTINVEYIDLFDGDIAYPHVKEDYAIALTRCRRYLYSGSVQFLRYVTTAGNLDYFQSPLLYFLKQDMVGTVTGTIDEDTVNLAFVGDVPYYQSSTYDVIIIGHAVNTADSSLATVNITMTTEPL